jgi:hypothetical protein
MRAQIEQVAADRAPVKQLLDGAPVVRRAPIIRLQVDITSESEGSR